MTVWLGRPWPDAVPFTPLFALIMVLAGAVLPPSRRSPCGVGGLYGPDQTAVG